MENTETNKPSLVSHALKFGGILGIIGIVLTALVYVADYTVMATFKFILLILIVSLGFIIYSGINYRKSIGGYISFGNAFGHSFLLMMVSGAVSTVFNILLYHVIDPEMPQKLGDAIIANTQSMMESFGAPQGSIDEALDKMKGSITEQFSVGGLLIGYAKSAIWSCVLALITALIVKKSEPIAF